MKEFDFLRAKKLDEALDYLQTLNNVKVIAGGTDLVVDIRKDSKRLPQIDYVLDISSVEELMYIRRSNEYVEIGPLVTHNQLNEDTIIKEEVSVLAEAANGIGSNQIRNRGTIGGNLCNTATCADLIPPLLALKAQVELSSKNSKRAITLEEFVAGPYKNTLEKGEILTGIKIPVLKGKYYSYYYKVGRRKALNISRLTIVLLARIEDSVFKDVRFVPGAVTSYPREFCETEKALCGRRIDEVNIEEIGIVACSEMLSITGERWSTAYKKPVIASLVKRALVKGIKEVEGVE